MRNHIKTWAGAALALSSACALTIAAPAAAVTVDFGGPAIEAGDCTPGCTPRFQTVYSGSVFGSSPVSISAIALYLAGTADNQTYTISLSTSANSVGNLSSTFANNIGADAAVFYSGIPAVSTTGDWFTFSGSTFNYNPTAGDLLLDIRTTGSNSIAASYDGSGPNGQRAYSFSDSAQGELDGAGYHMAAQFTVGAVNAVPEPMTWAMLVVGFGMAGSAVRSRRRTAGQSVLSLA